MDLILLRAHQQQINHQCSAALLAAREAQDALENPIHQERFWIAIQNLLTASANISKALWGQGGKLSKERKPLRDSLDVQDDSSLASTDLRNHLEHYDDRLDRWYTESQNHNLADFIIGPAKNTFNGLAKTDVFRHYDPHTGDVIFWGEHYNIPKIIQAVERLKPNAAAEAKRPHW